MQGEERDQSGTCTPQLAAQPVCLIRLIRPRGAAVEDAPRHEAETIDVVQRLSEVSPGSDTGSWSI